MNSILHFFYYPTRAPGTILKIVLNKYLLINESFPKCLSGAIHTSFHLWVRMTFHLREMCQSPLAPHPLFSALFILICKQQIQHGNRGMLLSVATFKHTSSFFPKENVLSGLLCVHKILQHSLNSEKHIIMCILVTQKFPELST